MKKNKIYSSNIIEGIQKDTDVPLYQQEVDYGKYATETEVVDLTYHQYLKDLKLGRNLIGTPGQAGNYSLLYMSWLEGGDGYVVGSDISLDSYGHRPPSLYANKKNKDDK